MFAQIQKCLKTTVLMVFQISAVAAKPQEISDQASRGCICLGEVVGNSGYGKNPNWKPIAKTYAENRAESLGASHLGPLTYKPQGSFNGEARGKAYTCP